MLKQDPKKEFSRLALSLSIRLEWQVCFCSDILLPSKTFLDPLGLVIESRFSLQV